jgi:hypothetical protein
VKRFLVGRNLKKIRRPAATAEQEKQRKGKDESHGSPEIRQTASDIAIMAGKRLAVPLTFGGRRLSCKISAIATLVPIQTVLEEIPC